MAEGSSGGGMGLLGVIIGAVLVLAVAFFLFGGGLGTSPNKSSVDVTIKAPTAPAAPATK